MKKAKVYILIYLGMMLPVFLSAAPIDKYYVPQQQNTPRHTVQTGGSNDYTDFRNKVSKLSDPQKKELKNSLKKEKDNAANTDIKKYYQDLINILN